MLITLPHNNSPAHRHVLPQCVFSTGTFQGAPCNKIAMQSKAELSYTGPPPDAVLMSCNLVGATKGGPIPTSPTTGPAMIHTLPQPCNTQHCCVAHVQHVAHAACM